MIRLMKTYCIAVLFLSCSFSIASNYENGLVLNDVIAADVKGNEILFYNNKGELRLFNIESNQNKLINKIDSNHTEFIGFYNDEFIWSGTYYSDKDNAQVKIFDRKGITLQDWNPESVIHSYSKQKNSLLFVDYFGSVFTYKKGEIEKQKSSLLLSSQYISPDNTSIFCTEPSQFKALDPRAHCYRRHGYGATSFLFRDYVVQEDYLKMPTICHENIYWISLKSRGYSIKGFSVYSNNDSTEKLLDVDKEPAIACHENTAYFFVPINSIIATNKDRDTNKYQIIKHQNAVIEKVWVTNVGQLKYAIIYDGNSIKKELIH